MTKTERDKKNAKWREWYHANKGYMSGYYKKRYKKRVKTETAKQREARLERQRKAQRKYAKEHAAEISQRRMEEREKRCSGCKVPFSGRAKKVERVASTGKTLGFYHKKCFKKGWE